MDARFVSAGEKKFKYILVGDTNVGKTALFWRFTEDNYATWKETEVTTIDFKIKDITIGEETIKLYLWDTAGTQKYRAIVSTYFKGCQGVILAFDLSSAKTFQSATTEWYNLIKDKAPLASVILVGNKNDLPNDVDEENVKQWCTQHSIQYISTSVKENINVAEVFEKLTKMVLTKQQETKKINITLKDQKKSSRKCC